MAVFGDNDRQRIDTYLNIFNTLPKTPVVRKQAAVASIIDAIVEQVVPLCLTHPGLPNYPDDLKLRIITRVLKLYSEGQFLPNLPPYRESKREEVITRIFGNHSQLLAAAIIKYMEMTGTDLNKLGL